jgi:stage II sporulation protein D
LAVAAALPAQTSVKVRVGAETLTLPLERYVAAALAGEAGTFRSAEALRAMAVAVRTYAVRLRGRHAAEGYDFC